MMLPLMLAGKGVNEKYSNEKKLQNQITEIKNKQQGKYQQEIFIAMVPNSPISPPELINFDSPDSQNGS